MQVFYTHRADVSFDKLEVQETSHGLEVVEVGAVIQLVHHHNLREQISKRRETSALALVCRSTRVGGGTRTRAIVPVGGAAHDRKKKIKKEKKGTRHRQARYGY